MSFHKKKFVNPHKLEKRLQMLSKESHLRKETVRQLLYYFQHLTTRTNGKMPRSLFRQEMTGRWACTDRQTD